MFTDALAELHELLPQHLIAVCEQLSPPKGTYLFRAGDKPERMYFVVNGEVTLERLGRQGACVVLQRTRRGFVGEASLFSPVYHCHGQVIGNTVMIQVPIRLVREALESDTAFAGRWIGMLNQEVKRLRLHCERLSMTKVQDRFVHLLETEGVKGCFPISTSIKSLASELGVTHEALYRCIHAMEKAGTLRRTANHVCLENTAFQKGRTKQ